MAKRRGWNQHSDRDAEDERNGIAETQYLLRSPVNAARLLAAIEEADKGRLIGRELLDAAADTPGS